MKIKRSVFSLLLTLVFAGSMAQPVITGFSPSSGKAGTAVTITGTGFGGTTADYVVYFGAVQASNVSVDATTLTVTVPVGATYAPISVINVSTGKAAMTSSPFEVTLGIANGRTFYDNSFAAPAVVSLNGFIYGIAFGDLDGDLKADLVFANESNGAMYVYQNTSVSGTLTSNSFEFSAGLSSGAEAHSVALADIDADGKLDVIVTNYTDNSLSVFRNLSSGPGGILFDSRVVFPTGQRPVTIAIRDVDGDGKLDIAVANAWDVNVSVLRNTSSPGVINASSLAAPVNFSTPGANAMTLCDMDGDDKPDMIVGNFGQPNVSFLLNTSSSGTISFGAPVNKAAGGAVYDVQTGDFDGDGKQDVLVGRDGGFVSVLRNTSTTGNINTDTRVDLETGGTSRYVAVGDLDGDGKPDIALVNQSTNKVSIFKNSIASPGTFTEASFSSRVDLNGQTSFKGIAIADIDNDSKPDIAAIGRDVLLYHNVFDFEAATPSGLHAVGSDTQNALLWSHSTEGYIMSYKVYGGTSPNPTTYLGTVNIPGNSYHQTGLANGTTYYYRITAVDPLGNESAPTADVTVIPGATTPPAVASVSPMFGHVGSEVIITGSNFSATASQNTVYFGATRATVASASASELTVTAPVGATYEPVTVTNLFTGLSASSLQSFDVKLGRGLGREFSEAFLPGSEREVQGLGLDIAIGDLNNDGKPDLVRSTPGRLDIYRNISAAGDLSPEAFGAPEALIYGTNSVSSASVMITDVDGDGLQDIVATLEGTSGFFVFRNTGDGIEADSFIRIQTDGSLTRAIAVGDIDMDGRKDIVTSGPSDMLKVWRNTSIPGTISFTTEEFNSFGGTEVRSIALGDLDGDGKPEVIATSPATNAWYVLRNISSPGSLTAASFATKLTIATGAGIGPIALAVADMDGDGKQDVVLGNGSGKSLSIYRNTATVGSISAASFTQTDFTTGVAGPGSTLNHGKKLVIADLDGDGKPDVVAANLNSTGARYLSVYKNQAEPGSISASALLPGQNVTDVGDEYGAIAVGDLNGDDTPDIVLLGRFSLFVFRNVLDLIAPSVPLVSARAGDAQNMLSWTASPEEDATTYKIYGGTTPDPEDLVTTVNHPATYYVHTGLTNGTPYYYRMTAVDGAGNESEFSAEVSATPEELFLPVITEVTPASGNIGTTVTITGTHFDATPDNNIVRFGAVIASVVTASATQLTVNVPAGAAYAPISVLNTTTGLTGSSSLYFSPTYGLPARDVNLTERAFAPRVDFETVPDATFMLSGDIDGDGKPDAVVIGTTTNNPLISLYHNTSAPGIIEQSTFAAPVNLTGGQFSQAAVLEDLDNDGKPDLIVANRFDDNISIYRNTAVAGSLSATSFADPVHLATGGSPVSIAVADVDGDGKRDIAVSEQNTGTVSLFRNIATAGSITTGSFDTKITFSQTSTPQRIVFADIDGDGAPELITAQSQQDQLSVRRNTASPGSITANSFGAPVYFGASSATEIVTADLDRDGKLDIIVRSESSTATMVFHNTASIGNITTASLTPALEFQSNFAPDHVAIGDIDGDGRQDIVISEGVTMTAHRNISAPGVLDNESFASAADLPLLGDISAHGMTFSDIDGDGQCDLLWVGNTQSIHVSRNTVDPVAPATLQLISVTPDDGEATVQIASSTDDDLAEYVVFVSTDPDEEPFVGEGAYGFDAIGETFTVDRLENGVTYYFWITAIDAYGNIGAFSNSLSTTPQAPPSPVITEMSPGSAVAGTSVILTGENFNTTPSGNLVHFGVTKAEVTLASATQLEVTVPTGATYGSLSVLDVVSGRSGRSRLPFAGLVGAGIGQDFTTTSFNPRADAAVMDGYNEGIAFGDIDGDGKPDLAITNYYLNTVSVFRNISTPGSTGNVFADGVDFQTGAGPAAVVIADLDNDGKNDMIVANTDENTLYIYQNTATSGTIDGSSFISPQAVSTGSGPYRLCVSDVDVDGKQDVIVSNINDGNIGVYRNSSLSGNILFEDPEYFGGGSYYSVTAGDLDGDGKPEIIVADANGAIAVFHNTTNRGTISADAFASVVEFTAEGSPFTVAIADLDRDGKPDLLASDVNSNIISVFHNTSSAGTIDEESFAPREDITTTGEFIYSLAVDDFDGDGRPDIAALDLYTSDIFVLRNKSVAGTLTAASFQSAVTLVPGANASPYMMQAGDLDGDGKSDLVTTNATQMKLMVLQNVMDLEAPATPTGLAATPGDDNIVLTWNAGTDINLELYNIYAGTEPNPTTLLDVVSATDVTYTHEGVTPGILYYYRISAVKTFGYESEKTADALASIRIAATITFPVLADVVYGVADFAPGATSTNTDSPVQYASSNTAVATIVDGKIHLIAAGTTVITASQPQDETHFAAPEVTRQLVVSKATQTITFNAPADKKSGDATFTLTASSTSELAVEFSTTTSELVSITGKEVTILKSGRANITATQPGDDRYTAATPVTQSFCIVPARPAVTLNLDNPETPVLTSNAASGNQWYLNGTAIDGATGTSYAVAGQGTYTVKVTADDCASELSAAMPIIITATSPTEATTMLQVHPNPVAEKITVSVPGKGVKRILITSLEGRVVYSSELAGEEVTVDVTNYAGGVYVVSATTQQRSEAVRFVKK
jgi:fibronectin type 3 domain-containing protein